MKQRLSKVMAAAGVASRRACEELIFAGHVQVNGKKADLPQTMVDPEEDTIKVKGKTIKKVPKKVYYALHKPVGYTCTNSPQVKKRAVDLIETDLRLFTIGRLDKETSGIILLTNDGHFAHRVMHPSGGVKKEYIAKVNREITDEHLKRLSRGCHVEGVLVRPVGVKKVRRATIRIVVQEGRHHEVRELLKAVGLVTIELKRVRIGGLSLGKLPSGSWKLLEPSEVERLFPNPKEQKKK
jgi:23S rRNA pseudouridine2605 synthase